MSKLNHLFYYTFIIILFVACKTNDSPSDLKMKECLSNELMNKAIIVSYDHQDGLFKEKDGVKYYEGYFNAEIKFITNTDDFKAGERFKIIKATLSFMKTENGWNCQEFNIDKTNIIRIKEQAGNIKPNNVPVIKKDDSEINDVSNELNSKSEELYEAGYYIVNGNDERKIYFHNTADASTKRKAYISTQENVFVEKVENGFGYTQFTNEKGISSYGWLDMKLLIKKPN